jgi:hypothetical protein
LDNSRATTVYCAISIVFKTDKARMNRTMKAMIIIVLSLNFVYQATGGIVPSCGGTGACVARKSLYWKTKNTFSSKPAEYFVCRFAKSARNACGASWDNCVGWYVGVKHSLNPGGNFLNAGTTGFNNRDCNYNYCNSECSQYDHLT